MVQGQRSDEERKYVPLIVRSLPLPAVFSLKTSFIISHPDLRERDFLSLHSICDPVTFFIRSGSFSLPFLSPPLSSI